MEIFKNKWALGIVLTPFILYLLGLILPEGFGVTLFISIVLLYILRFGKEFLDWLDAERK